MLSIAENNEDLSKFTQQSTLRLVYAKNSPANAEDEMQEMCVLLLGWADACRRKWQPTPVFLSGKCHGWRSLSDYDPWGCKIQHG